MIKSGRKAVGIALGAAAAVCVSAGVAVTVGITSPVVFDGAATAGFSVRDPYTLFYQGTYYLYGTGISWPGYGCRTSEDLENWSEPVRVLDPELVPDAEGDWWAPECHYYEGTFYLFATYRSAESGKRGTAVFRSESPLGPFEPWSDGHATPAYRDCIDGTLYVDEAGQPWMAYVEEWTSNEDGVGTMAVCRLSDDLRRLEGESKTVFSASDVDSQITDGPCLYKTEKGVLVMLWSTSGKRGYSVRQAYCADGVPDGEWAQLPMALYEGGRYAERDGGHAMLFRDASGRLMMSIHTPNSPGEGDFSKPLFIEVYDFGKLLKPAASNFDGLFARFSADLKTDINRLNMVFGKRASR